MNHISFERKEFQNQKVYIYMRWIKMKKNGYFYGTEKVKIVSVNQ